MDIVCCTDNDYIMPCGVLLCSLCENSELGSVRFHIIISKRISEIEKASLINIVNRYKNEIFFYIIDESWISNLPIGMDGQQSHITLATYFRLYLSELLPVTLNKILYLDCDIVVRHSINDLWNMNIENYAIGCVPDADDGQILNYNRLKYSQRLGYFNAGVLLINLKYWRAHDIFNRFLIFIRQYPERILYHDQDIMNYVLKDEKVILPLKYNVTNGLLNKEIHISWEYESELMEALKNPYILHYISHNKPWIKGCTHPFKAEFFKYRDMTEWKKMPLLNRHSTFKEKVKSILCKVGILSNQSSYRKDLFL